MNNLFAFLCVLCLLAALGCLLLVSWQIGLALLLLLAAAYFFELTDHDQ